MTVPTGFTTCNTESQVSAWLRYIEQLVQSERWRRNKANIICVAEHLTRCMQLNDDGTVIAARVTKRHLAEISGLSPSSVLRVLKLLESYSMLYCEHSASFRSRKESSCWQPLLPAVSPKWTKPSVTSTALLSSTPPYRFSSEKPKALWSSRANSQVNSLIDSRNNVWHGHRNAWLIYVTVMRSPAFMRLGAVRAATGLGARCFAAELRWLVSMGILNFFSQHGVKDQWVIDKPLPNEDQARAHHADGPNHLAHLRQRIEAERAIHRRWIAEGCKTKVMRTLKWRQDAAWFNTMVERIADGWSRAAAQLEADRVKAATL